MKLPQLHDICLINLPRVTPFVGLVTKAGPLRFRFTFPEQNNAPDFALSMRQVKTKGLVHVMAWNPTALSALDFILAQKPKPTPSTYQAIRLHAAWLWLQTWEPGPIRECDTPLITLPCVQDAALHFGIKIQVGPITPMPRDESEVFPAKPREVRVGPWRPMPGYLRIEIGGTVLPHITEVEALSLIEKLAAALSRQ